MIEQILKLTYVDRKCSFKRDSTWLNLIHNYSRIAISQGRLVDAADIAREGLKFCLGNMELQAVINLAISGEEVSILKHANCSF